MSEEGQPPASAVAERLRAELEQLSPAALVNRAEEMGVNSTKLADAQDSAEIIALILSSEAERVALTAQTDDQLARLRHGLESLKPHALTKKAQAAGVDAGELVAAQSREEIIALILALPDPWASTETQGLQPGAVHVVEECGWMMFESKGRLLLKHLPSGSVAALPSAVKAVKKASGVRKTTKRPSAKIIDATPNRGLRIFLDVPFDSFGVSWHAGPAPELDSPHNAEATTPSRELDDKRSIPMNWLLVKPYIPAAEHFIAPREQAESLHLGETRRWDQWNISVERQQDKPCVRITCAIIDALKSEHVRVCREAKAMGKPPLDWPQFGSRYRNSEAGIELVAGKDRFIVGDSVPDEKLGLYRLELLNDGRIEFTDERGQHHHRSLFRQADDHIFRTVAGWVVGEALVVPTADIGTPPVCLFDLDLFLAQKRGAVEAVLAESNPEKEHDPYLVDNIIAYWRAAVQGQEAPEQTDVPEGVCKALGQTTSARLKQILRDASAGVQTPDQSTADFSDALDSIAGIGRQSVRETDHSSCSEDDTADPNEPVIADLNAMVALAASMENFAQAGTADLRDLVEEHSDEGMQSEFGDGSDHDAQSVPNIANVNHGAEVGSLDDRPTLDLSGNLAASLNQTIQGHMSRAQMHHLIFVHCSTGAQVSLWADGSAGGSIRCRFPQSPEALAYGFDGNPPRLSRGMPDTTVFDVLSALAKMEHSKTVEIDTRDCIERGVLIGSSNTPGAAQFEMSPFADPQPLVRGMVTQDVMDLAAAASELDPFHIPDIGTSTTDSQRRPRLQSGDGKSRPLELWCRQPQYAGKTCARQYLWSAKGHEWSIEIETDGSLCIHAKVYHLRGKRQALELDAFGGVQLCGIQLCPGMEQSAPETLPHKKGAESLPLRSDEPGPAVARRKGFIHSPGQWDVMISYTQRTSVSETLAANINGELSRRGVSVWWDIKMHERDEQAMQEGVQSSSCVIAIVSGPSIDPQNPDVPPESNAYFNREFCLKELRWAVEAGVFIQPVVAAEDKRKITEFFSIIPHDLQRLKSVNWEHLDWRDVEYFELGVTKIMRHMRPSEECVLQPEPEPHREIPAALGSAEASSPRRKSSVDAALEELSYLDDSDSDSDSDSD